MGPRPSALPGGKNMNAMLIEQFRAVVGEAGLLLGDAISARNIHVWRQQPIRAMVIVRPASTAEVSAVLRLCHAVGQTVVAHGGLTGLVQGCNGTEADVVLSLERLNRIEEIDPIGRTMTVEAGVPLQILQEAAEKHGLIFPVDLGARGSCQIGGNVSTNAGGNRVIQFGMTISERGVLLSARRDYSPGARRTNRLDQEIVRRRTSAVETTWGSSLHMTEWTSRTGSSRCVITLSTEPRSVVKFFAKLGS